MAGSPTVPETALTPMAWNRVENGNHYRRDASLGEDKSRIRARHAPANNATLALANRGFRHLPEANRPLPHATP